MVTSFCKTTAQLFFKILFPTKLSPNDDEMNLVGAIGCSVDVIASMNRKLSPEASNEPPSPQMAILTRGSFRFIVKSIESTFPYPVAIVDELIDDPEKEKVIYYNDFEDEQHEDDEGDEDFYAELDASNLSSRCLHSMEIIIDQKLSQSTPTILEKTILSNTGLPEDTALSNAEEMAAVMTIFRSELVEINDATIRRYAIGMMAAEIGRFNNDERKNILMMKDGVERLRFCLRSLDRIISLQRAKDMAQEITQESDGDQMDLKVGTPSFPDWAKRIAAGNRLEYFWNEEYEWLTGTVVEVEKIIDELIITVLFDDGETHRLAFLAEEKVRWRPAS